MQLPNYNLLPNIDMTKEDLDMPELAVLREINNKSEIKYDGILRVIANRLCSYQLVESLSNLRYEITNAGKELLIN